MHKIKLKRERERERERLTQKGVAHQVDWSKEQKIQARKINTGTNFLLHHIDNLEYLSQRHLRSIQNATTEILKLQTFEMEVLFY